MQPLSYYNELFTEFSAFQKGGNVDLNKVTAIGKRLKLEGFKAESDFCFEICIKAIENFAAAGAVNNCLAMEGMIYASFVKTTESEEHYFSAFNRWSGLLQNLGRKQARPFTTKRNPKSVCFILTNGVVLGHTEVMLETIDGWRALGFDHTVYVAALSAQCEPKLKAMLDARGVKLVISGQLGGTQSQALLRLRDQLEELSVQTVVWMSVATMASFALSMRLAPRQIFWSLKLHPVFIPEVDVHICAGHETEDVRVFNGHTWVVSPFPLTIACRPNDAQSIAAFKKRFPSDAILVGSLAREEKLCSTPFLSAVCNILISNPRAHYLWTGRGQPPEVLSAFANSGVAERCHFIGWVDTNLIAEALDVFLETFPFGCGITGYQAMGHGTPVLSIRAPDTLYGSLLRSAVEKSGHAPCRQELEKIDILTAENMPHYVELGQKLIADLSFRSEISEREKEYFSREKLALPRYAARLWRNMTGRVISDP